MGVKFKSGCPWCGLAAVHRGTTTDYDCGSSIGCAHQRQSAACREIARLREQLNEVIETATPIVTALQEVGDFTDWRDGDETDRVYAWYEVRPLKEAIAPKPQAGRE